MVGSAITASASSEPLTRWVDLNARLAAIKPGSRRQLRDAIAAVYDTIAGTSGRLLQDFADIAEADIVAGLEARAAAAEQGSIAVALGGDKAAILLDAARLLRALEEVATEGEGYLEGDDAGDIEKAFRTTDGRHYVIPRMTALAVPEGKPFMRRALQHYRVLPTTVGVDCDDRFAVRLHRSRDPASLDAAALEKARERRYGAAFFPDLQVSLKPKTAGPFVVDDLTGFDAPTLLAGHLSRGRDEGCEVIVWGELTMPETNVAAVQQWFSDEAFSDEPGFRFLVLGSWHRAIDGLMRNVATVLDGDGAILFEVQKWAKFRLGARPEAIEPGKDIHVLVGEQDLTVFAICRDFLEIGSDQPYSQLNVDVAIVPSMIASIDEVTTLQNHAAAAQRLSVLYGTRTLVVAQPSVACAGKPVGQVMAFPAKPLDHASVLVNGPWHLCILDSS